MISSFQNPCAAFGGRAVLPKSDRDDATCADPLVLLKRKICAKRIEEEDHGKGIVPVFLRGGNTGRGLGHAPIRPNIECRIFVFF
jgi:hypothetical protein